MPSHTRKRPIDPNIGLRIELARRRRDLSQAQLAERVGVTESAISHWETSRHVPRDNIVALAKALEVSVAWLRGEGILSEDQRKLEETLLRLALEGGREMQDLLVDVSPDELMAWLRGRKFSKMQ